MKFEPGGFARGTSVPADPPPPPPDASTYVTPRNLDLKTGTYPKRQIRPGIF